MACARYLEYATCCFQQEASHELPWDRLSYLTRRRSNAAHNSLSSGGGGGRGVHTNGVFVSRAYNSFQSGRRACRRPHERRDGLSGLGGSSSPRCTRQPPWSQSRAPTTCLLALPCQKHLLSVSAGKGAGIKKSRRKTGKTSSLGPMQV